MAKKKRSDEVQGAYENYASGIESASQNVAEGMTAAGTRQMEDLEAAERARQDAYNASVANYQQQKAEGYGSFADIVSGYADQLKKAEEENAAQVAADYRAARWTGATELASSIANLIAVGGHNAVSQQYKPYSQDWMRKADMDARTNRARIDNLRERQRAMQQQLVNLRLGDADRALQMERERANAAYQHGLSMAQARYNTSVNPLNVQLQGAEKAGQVRAQGATQAANIGLHEQQLAQQAYNQSEQRKETARYHDEQLKLAREKAAKEGGKNTMSILVNLDGRDVTLNIPKENYAAALERGVPDLRDDVLAMAKAQGFKGDSWDALVSANERSGMSRKELRKAGGGEQYDGDLSGIITIIGKQPNEYTEEDLEQINNFLKNSYRSTQKFNEHLSKVSSGAIRWASGADLEERADNGETPAPSSVAGNGGDEDISFNDESQSEQTGMPTAATETKKKNYFGGKVKI